MPRAPRVLLLSLLVAVATPAAATEFGSGFHPPTSGNGTTAEATVPFAHPEPGVNLNQRLRAIHPEAIFGGLVAAMLVTAAVFGVISMVRASRGPGA